MLSRIRVAGFVVVAVIACAAAPARATSYSIAAATCSYADYNNTGFSGTYLDVNTYTSGTFTQTGVHDMTAGNQTWSMFCAVDVADGSTFNKIGIIAYDNAAARAVSAYFYRQPISTTAASFPRGNVTSVDSASVQRQDASFTYGVETINNTSYSYYVWVVFYSPLGYQGNGAWLFDVLLWQAAADADAPPEARCVDPSLLNATDTVAAAWDVLARRSA